MERKDFKIYETPACEVVELKLQGMLCASKIEGVDDTSDLNGGNDNPGF